MPHDVYGLVDLMGKDFFIQELTAFFDKTPEDFLWNDYYNHPNEPATMWRFSSTTSDAPG